MSVFLIRFLLQWCALHFYFHFFSFFFLNLFYEILSHLKYSRIHHMQECASPSVGLTGCRKATLFTPWLPASGPPGRFVIYKLLYGKLGLGGSSQVCLGFRTEFWVPWSGEIAKWRFRLRRRCVLCPRAFDGFEERILGETLAYKIGRRIKKVLQIEREIKVELCYSKSQMNFEL